jgi:hypothetical protein
MPLSNDVVYELAILALREMLTQFGPEHKFPADAIWQHTPPDVLIPSTALPHHPRAPVALERNIALDLH